MPIPSCYRPRVCHANLSRKHLREVNGADLLRWQMVDTDFYSYFCIYLFCLSRGMSEPLLPKAITAWARALPTRHFVNPANKTSNTGQPDHKCSTS